MAFSDEDKELEKIYQLKSYQPMKLMTEFPGMAQVSY